MSETKQPVKQDQPRHVRREAKQINDILLSLLVNYIKFLQRLPGINRMTSTEEEIKEYEQKIANKYLTLNASWLNTCHKKWKYNKCHKDAFTKQVEVQTKNFNLQTKIKNHEPIEENRST